MKITPGDVLSIAISSLSKAEDDVFNLAATDVSPLLSGSATSQSTGGNVSGYLVHDDGTILLHKLGAYQAAGYTRKQLSARIAESLLPYLKDPIVSVNFINHKVTVMGAVKSPQVLFLPDEKMPLIDAIVKSGDLTSDAIVNDVMVIRESNNSKVIKHINLQDASLFTSPWYYVKPNDIVYVMADQTRKDAEEKRRNLQTTLSLIISIVSLFTVTLIRFVN